MRKSIILLLVVTIITLGLIFNNTVSAEGLQGKGYTNLVSEDGTTYYTLGSIALRSNTKELDKLRCGIRGILDPYTNTPIKQILVCDDHSRFELRPTEIMQPSIDSFVESSVITVVEGPIFEAGYSSGTAITTGTFKKLSSIGIPVWIDMEIEAEIQ